LDPEEPTPRGKGSYNAGTTPAKDITMYSKTIFTFAALLLMAANEAEGQQWRPSSTEMPAMPRMSDLSGDWLGPNAAWFSGVAAISGVEPSQLRAAGEPRRGASDTQVVRFNNGPVPVVIWQDRNADGRADIIEIYRSGGVIVQVIDADYDGRANVVRTYDAGGRLAGEERL
jgi:hypothetical protein